MEKESLFKIKRRLERLGDKSIGEAQTKESFINPLLTALGWDISDFDEVKLEYKHTRKDTPVDYALLIDMIPKLYVEAKQLGANLEDRKWSAQVLTYATMAGVKWALLTDGNHYKLFNTMAEARLEEKLFYELRIKDLTEDNVDSLINFLNLLTKEKFKDDEIEIAWKNHFEVNKVKKILKKIIDDRDEAILNLIKRKTKLKRATVVNSLNKLKIKIEKIHTPELHIPITKIGKIVPKKETEVQNAWNRSELLSNLSEAGPYQSVFFAALVQIESEPIKKMDLASLMNNIASMKSIEGISKTITGFEIAGARSGWTRRTKRLKKERIVDGEWSNKEKDHIYVINSKYESFIKEWAKANNLWIKEEGF